MSTLGNTPNLNIGFLHQKESLPIMVNPGVDGYTKKLNYHKLLQKT